MLSGATGGAADRPATAFRVGAGPGRGGNQYKAGSAARSAAGSTSQRAAAALLASPLQPRPVLCGQIWGTQCTEPVTPPSWAHQGQHPHPSQTMCERAARDPDTPPAVLQHLSSSSHHAVLRALASNPKAPPAILEQLSRRRITSVRMRLVRNPSCPVPALERLLSGPDPAIAQAAADHPALPRATRAMWQLARR
jgi:hypothetical protein